MTRPAPSILFPMFIGVFAFLSLTGLPAAQLKAQPQIKLKANLTSYIKQYSDEAVRQMVKYRIPASVVLAQAIFESGSGTSDLAVKSNNHFGIKCHVEWEGDTITKTDDTLNECFRKYYSVRESYTDHSIFLSSRERYAFLFDLPIGDYAGWCYGLKNAGYATYSTYAEDLIKLIEEQKLYELDSYVNLERKPVAYFKHGKIPPLIPTRLKTVNFTLKDFSKEGVLWLDEKDVLVQSIDMILDGGESDELMVSTEE